MKLSRPLRAIACPAEGDCNPPPRDPLECLGAGGWKRIVGCLTSP